jgi:ElaB/YqjD/DUF883 family membrane-anchored ribosome-binding protein
MTEDNKNLKDDLDDLLGAAKEGAKKAKDKASGMAGEAKEKISRFTEEAKEKASEFAEDAKQAAEEFTEDAQQVFRDGKNVAIIAHLTIIGWIIAVVMNGSHKTLMGSFYIRQVLGLIIVAIVCSWIPVVNVIAGVVLFIAWLMSLMSAFSGQLKPTFVLGNQFQDWFRAL